MIISALNRSPQRRESVTRRIHNFDAPLIAEQCASGQIVGLGKVITADHIFTTYGFSSTSDGTNNFNGQVEYRLKKVTGLDISPLSQFPGEKEFLLLPTKMAITSYQNLSGRHIMTAEEVRILPPEQTFVIWVDKELIPQLHPKFQTTPNQIPAINDFVIRHSQTYPGFLYTVEFMKTTGDIKRYRFVVNRDKNGIGISLSMVDFHSEFKTIYIPELQNGEPTTFIDINTMLKVMRTAIYTEPFLEICTY
jgi:hypothetical protein